MACAFFPAPPASAEVRTGIRVASRPVAEVRTGIRVTNRPAAAPAAKLPFGNIPKGPMQIFISINQQKLHLYSNGEAVAETLVATGVPQHPTPLGAFSIVQKQLLHHSNIYSGAPMPYMERITWSGVALHEGLNLGHPASHGCIRMSHDFAVRLYAVSKLGAEVFITNSELAPQEFADPHLFVRKDPSPPVLAAASVTLPSALAQDLRTATDAAAVETTHDNKPAADNSGPADLAHDDKPVADSATAADAAHDDKPVTDGATAADTAHDTKVIAEASSVRDISDPPLPTPAPKRPAWAASVAPTPLR